MPGIGASVNGVGPASVLNERSQKVLVEITPCAAVPLTLASLETCFRNEGTLSIDGKTV